MKQALKNADWLAAMQQEYDALLNNKTWNNKAMVLKLQIGP